MHFLPLNSATSQQDSRSTGTVPKHLLRPFHRVADAVEGVEAERDEERGAVVVEVSARSDRVATVLRPARMGVGFALRARRAEQAVHQAAVRPFQSTSRLIASISEYPVTVLSRTLAAKVRFLLKRYHYALCLAQGDPKYHR